MFTDRSLAGESPGRVQGGWYRRGPSIRFGQEKTLILAIWPNSFPMFMRMFCAYPCCDGA